MLAKWNLSLISDLYQYQSLIQKPRVLSLLSLSKHLVPPGPLLLQAPFAINRNSTRWLEATCLTTVYMQWSVFFFFPGFRSVCLSAELVARTPGAMFYHGLYPSDRGQRPKMLPQHIRFWWECNLIAIVNIPVPIVWLVTECSSHHRYRCLCEPYWCVQCVLLL